MKKNYQSKIDDIFGQTWEHSSLRTCFDPGSTEWQHTTNEQKLSILKKLIESGEPLEYWIHSYESFYLKEKSHVLKALPAALITLLASALKDK